MPKNFSAALKLPTAAALSEPKVLVRLALGVLFAANLVAAAFAFHLFDASPEALSQQLSATLAAKQKEQAALNRTRAIVANIERGRADGEKFLATYMTGRRNTYSTILGEITETAKSAGMDKMGGTMSLEPIPGSDDLDIMSISFNMEGTSPQLVKFVNLLDRSPKFLLIETLTVTPRVKSDILAVNLKLDTFVREDGPRPSPSPDVKAGAM